MKVKQVKEDYVGTYLVDEDTGEILSFVADTRTKPKVVSFSKEIGVDVPHPSECLTADSLMDTLKLMDAYISGKPKINTQLLLDSILQDCLSKSEVLLLTHVANNLSGWNYYIANMDELASCGIDKTNLSRTLKSLSPNLIKIHRKDKPYRGCIALKINPSVAWKGDLSYREKAIETWYKK